MNRFFSLAGKVALITGGARGLGRMIAEGFVEAGARVFITSRTGELCEAAAKEIGAIALPGDAGSPDGIATLGERFRKHGEERLHILVNNAGRTWGAPLDDFPDRAWASVLAVNVQAPFRLTQEVLPQLEAAAVAKDPARIINIGSVAGAVTNTLNAYSYIASKAALHQLSRQMARDLAPRRINVNALLPGFFATSMTAHLRAEPGQALEAQIPMGRLGEPEDIAGAAIFLAGPAGAYLTGIELPVDGGLTGCGWIAGQMPPVV